MRALVKTQKGVGHIEIRDVPIPEPGPDEVLLKVLGCGVCGTDIHVRDDEFPYWPPVILGHEFSGRVEKAGKNVTLVQEGDRVVGEPHTKACGHCRLCRTGNPQICAAKRSPGWGQDGGMAEYLVMPQHLLHRLPDNVDDCEACLIEPAANAVHDVVERAGVDPGDYVVVIGPGPIGLLAAMTARAAGARQVMILGTEVDEELRLKTARELGFSQVINIERENALEQLLDQTGGIGADLVVECSGSHPGIASTVELVRKKGRICAIGLPGDKPVAFPYNAAAFKVCDLYFCLSTSYTSWEKTIHLVGSGLLPIGKILTHRKPLEEWKSVFQAIDERRALKAVLLP